MESATSGPRLLRDVLAELYPSDDGFPETQPAVWPLAEEAKAPVDIDSA
jgi:hypothetical protein